MKRSVRILALCLAILCAIPLTAGAVAPQTMKLDAAWFEGDSGLYHHGLAQASMILSLQAYDGNEKTVLQNYGFSNIKNSTDLKHGSLFLLNYTIATAKIGDRTVVSVVFQDAKSGDQFQSIADFDGRKHGTDGKNSEIVALLASANAALNSLPDMEGDSSCIWISGYGYGGGAAELLAAMLNGETFKLGNTDCKSTVTADVRCYAFGTPAVSTQAATKPHDNIFVINNPEDLLVYLPGEEWGYHHFGAVIEMNTFKGAYTATDIQRKNIETNYSSYCGDIFYAYPAESYNNGTNDVEILVNYIYTTLTPMLDSYYNTTHSTGFFSSKTTYGLLTEVLTVAFTGNTDNLISTVGGIILFDSPYKPIIDFALVHGLHSTGLDNLSFDTFYELICAHTPSCYLAWMMATDRLTELSGATTDALERWMEVSVSGGNVTYAASVPGADTLWLAVYNTDGKMLKVEALGNGLIEDNLDVPNADSAKLFLLDSNFCPVE